MVFQGVFFLLFAAPTKPPSSSLNPAFIASLQETEAGRLKLEATTAKTKGGASGSRGEAACDTGNYSENKVA